MHKLPLSGCLLALLCVISLPSSADRVLHKERSLYQNIFVKEQFDRRCLIFTLKQQQRNQTCIDPRDPNRIVFAYVRMSLAGLLVNPSPERALMIGLGGGTISNVLTALYPDLTIDLVEIDPAVVRVAQEYFNFQATERTPVHTVDGRVFVRRALLKKMQYDLIILDAFTGDYIPEHLLTQEFLSEVKSLLTPGGIVVANTFTHSRLYDHESQTYAAVYGDFLNFKVRRGGNRVIVASNKTLPNNDQLIDRATALQASLSPYAVDPTAFVESLIRAPDWDTSARPLTDQYSPANLLRGQDR